MFGNNDDDEDEPERPDSEPEGTEPGGTTEPDGPTTDDLEVRLTELEEELASTESSIRSLRSSQEEVAETVEEVDDTVRQLLGVYDQLTAADNPFVDGDAGSGGTDGSLGEPAEADAAADGDGTSDRAQRDAHAEEDDAVVGFDDLAESVDEAESGSEGPAETEDGFLWEGDAPEPAETSADAVGSRRRRPATLTELPDGYAGDALVMEWLAMLVEEAGPAGTLRAIDHYEEVGWVGGRVRERLVDVLGGPDLDVHVDPNRPAEPSAAEHTESYRYIETLDRLADI